MIIDTPVFAFLPICLQACIHPRSTKHEQMVDCPSNTSRDQLHHHIVEEVAEYDRINPKPRQRPYSAAGLLRYSNRLAGYACLM